MIGLEDRQSIAQDIDTAHKAGARLCEACNVVGINVRTLQRWQATEGLVVGDLRPSAARPMPAHALSANERAQVLHVANEARFADVPPARIVPILADEGVYVASESTFSRVCAVRARRCTVGARKRHARCVRPLRTLQRDRARSGAGI